MAVAGERLPSVDVERAADRLSRLIRFETVSSRMGEPAVDQSFVDLLAWLEGAYPAIARVAETRVSPPYVITFEIRGANPSLDPILLIAHTDVVDVPPKTRNEWTHAPFGGEIDEGFVWGRGAIDDKGVLVSQMEAVEMLLEAGVRPVRGIILAFGGDEELSGANGAAHIAGEWSSRRFHFAMDEGAVVAKGFFSQPRLPVALIGIAEKGFVNIKLSARTPGGHAAMPPRRTAVGLLSEAIARIEDHPFPARLIYTVREFFRALAPRTGFPMKLVYGNPRLFWPVLRRVLDKKHSTRALIRTSQAVTMISGSEAPNVLPDIADAVINVRILPGDTVESVIRHYNKLLRDLDVEVGIHDPESAKEAVPGSSVDLDSYQSAKAIVESQIECVAAPFLVTVGTDSKWYASQCGAVYRFIAAILESGEIDRIHGVDERLSLANLERMIAFNHTLLQTEAAHG